MVRKTWVGALAAVALAGCGGDGLSAADYRARLDAACARAQRDNQRIPQIVKDRDLKLEQARVLGDEIGLRFRDTVTELDPPEELGDGHERLVSEVNAPFPADIEPIRRRTREAIVLYEQLGARGCANSSRLALRTYDRLAQR